MMTFVLKPLTKLQGGFLKTLLDVYRSQNISMARRVLSVLPKN